MKNKHQPRSSVAFTARVSVRTATIPAGAGVALAALVVALLVSGCATTSLPEDWTTLSAAQLVQRAQDATDKSNYVLAEKYYLALQEQYPEDTTRVLWASYEIAFLRYKRGRYQEAVELFDRLLAEYARRKEEQLPQGPRILAEKVRRKIIEEHVPDSKTAAGAGSTTSAQ